MEKIPILFFVVCLSCGQSNQDHFPIWSDDDRSYLLKEFHETGAAVHAIVDSLNSEQWNYKLSDDDWSIAYIIEHLQLQEDMHYREVRILSMQPPQPEYALQTIGNDEKVLAYEIDRKKGKADWNVMPLGRWSGKDHALQAFDRSREKMIELVASTKANLRQQITFRNIQDPGDFRKVRNLHQILLTTIAHTKRHTHQIRRTIERPNFPKD